LMFSDIAKEPQ